ncbi:protein trichome birefringence-like 1 [Cynara cardunculus var. scolymus]|uniref:protein trichome birefringence-like 1 n=1 Tax=Cynara cardunculus var. scolymus TaxID=59895 RepID=UPI000D623F3C|nr:protein trichome birefringence-like 1 [Cynara cardunculus var. scolymus]
MLDSSSNRRIFPQGRYMMFAFVFITFFVLISVLSIFIIPVSSYNFIQYNQSQVSALISRLLSNSTVSSPQFARKFDGFSRRDSWFSSNHNFSSGKTMAKPSSNDQIPKRTNGVSVEAPSPNGLSFNHDFSSWKSRIMPPDDARVSENPNGYLRKVKSPQGSVTNSHNQSNLIGKLESLVFSKNVDVEEEKKKRKRHRKNWIEKMTHCRFFNGRWVEDHTLPLYKPGSCPFIGESFDCFTNGKPEIAYQKYRWQPYECNLPRWNGKKMLRLLKGKRLVFVGDSLNRNMWESMVCMLRSVVHNSSNVYEAADWKDYRLAKSYSMIFRDYNFTVEYYSSPFLVREWKMQNANGSTKETLRLDLVHRSSDLYRNADILVFNTGHWWTHEKTSAGKGYYQEGDHVYKQLHVMEAFRKAMTTWGRWIEAKVSRKTLVFFRGYSSSHFSDGQWNSGGQCDKDNEPIVLEKDLPHENNRVMMEAAEAILTKMKIPILYLNITRMSEYRRDAHPSIYMKPNMTNEERMTVFKFQDCSHWCLPGVPDTWNEMLYGQLLLKYRQQLLKYKQ